MKISCKLHSVCFKNMTPAYDPSHYRTILAKKPAANFKSSRENGKQLRTNYFSCCLTGFPAKLTTTGKTHFSINPNISYL